MAQSPKLSGLYGPPSRSKKLLGAKGIATRNKNATNGAPGRTTRSKKLLGTSASLLVTSALLVVTRSY